MCRAAECGLWQHVFPRGFAAPVCDTGWYLVAALELAWLPTALARDAGNAD